MRRITFGAAAATLLLLVPASARAQARVKWKEIGRTSSGNRVYVDPKSVHANRDLRDATVRVVFTTPVASSDGPLYATRTKGIFNCTTRRLAVKENTFYGNAKETKVVEHKVNKIPGFGWVPEGSMGAVALGYLCKP
jgi:hypothetical protein